MVVLVNGQNLENAVNPVTVEPKYEQENAIVQLQPLVVKIVSDLHRALDYVTNKNVQVSIII